MPDNDDHNEDAVYRVDTVPPPDGDDDAYSAPTRVGPMAATVVNELIVAARTAEVAAASQAKPKPKKDDGTVGVLDEDDIEAELAFPPPPKVPAAGDKAPASEKPAVAAQPLKTKTQPVVPITPIASIKPVAPSTSAPPSSSAGQPTPNAAAKPANLPMPMPMMAGIGVGAFLVLVGILYVLFK